MAGGGSGEEADYWPGYVDALTAMVKVLAFVMMLLAVAVFVLSQNVSKQIVQQLAEAADVKTPPDASVEEITQKIRERLAERRPPPPPPSADQTPEQKVESTAKDSFVPQAPSQMVASGTKLVVTFPDRVTRIDPEANQKLAEFVKPLAGTGRRFAVLSHADMSSASLTEARRIAYFRALQLRAQIIASGFQPDQVSMQVVDVSDAAKGRTAEVVAR